MKQWQFSSPWSRGGFIKIQSLASQILQVTFGWTDQGSSIVSPLISFHVVAYCTIARINNCSMPLRNVCSIYLSNPLESKVAVSTNKCEFKWVSRLFTYPEWSPIVSIHLWSFDVSESPFFFVKVICSSKSVSTQNKLSNCLLVAPKRIQRCWFKKVKWINVCHKRE